MLSIEDIKNARFRRATFGGYKPEDVDMFIDDIQLTFEEMESERKKLILAVRKLNEKLDKFHEEESSIRNVILSAQKIAEKTLNSTEIQTNDMIKDAALKSEEIIKQAQYQVKIQSEISETLRGESENLKNKLLQVYKQHMKLLEEIPCENNLLNCKLQNKESYKTETLPESKENIEFTAENSSVPITGNIFSNEFSKKGPSFPKFKDLKFGQNYDLQNEKDMKNVSGGAFGGLFRKNEPNI